MVAPANNPNISNALNSILDVRDNVSLFWRIESYSDVYPSYSLGGNVAQWAPMSVSSKLMLDFRVTQTLSSYFPPSDDLENIDKSIGVLLKKIESNFISRVYSPSRDSTSIVVSYVIEVGEPDEFFVKLEKVAKDISDSIFTKELEVNLSED